MIGLTSFSNSTARTRGLSLSSWENAEPTATRLPAARAAEERQGTQECRHFGAVRIVSAGLLFPCDAARGLLVVASRSPLVKLPRLHLVLVLAALALPGTADAGVRVGRARPAGCRPECLARAGRDGRVHARAARRRRFGSTSSASTGAARGRCGSAPRPRPAAGAPGTPRGPRRRTDRTRRAARTAPLAGWKLGNPYWTGSARRLQLRVRGDVTRVRAFYLWSPVTAAPAERTSAAGPTRPAIITRAAWGADEQIVRGTPAYASRLAFSVVHHTAGAAPRASPVGRDGARDPELPRALERLERHRLQLPRRSLRPGLRGPERRDHEARDRRARAWGSTPAASASPCSGRTRRAGSAKAAQAALVKLLAWRLDIAHVDPTSRLTWMSARQPEVPGREGRVSSRRFPATATPADRLPGRRPLRDARLDRRGRPPARRAEDLLPSRDRLGRRPDPLHRAPLGVARRGR